MKVFLFIALTFFLAGPALAQSQLRKDISGSVIPDKVINDMYESCKYHIPKRFTPDAREYYCACMSAAVKANLNFAEFNNLQQRSARNAANKTFEKYVTKAVKPCIDMPVEQIEYLACIVDNSTDRRVSYIPGYCRCVSQKLKAHAIKLGDAEIMSEIAGSPGDYSNGFIEPVDALWANQTYIRAGSKARDECILNPTTN